MRAKLIDLQFTYDGKQRLILETPHDFREKYDLLQGKELEVSIKRYSEKRSLSANAYFHVLVGKIADEKSRQGFNESNDEVKKQIVIDYGTLARDKNGTYIGFKLPADVDVDEIYPYTKQFDERIENGKTFRCYLVYKRTSAMNNSEMCRLIDGAIQVAKELGVDTETPEEIERMKHMWEDKI